MREFEFRLNDLLLRYEREEIDREEYLQAIIQLLEEYIKLRYGEDDEKLNRLELYVVDGEQV